MNHYGRDQRDYIRFRESDSYDDRFRETRSNSRETPRYYGRLSGRNRFGEERIRHDPFQDYEFRNDYDPTYEDEYGMKHPYEHGGGTNRWSDDLRSESATESHTGKGPKGYQRSAERIKEEANEILTRDFNLDASDIEVDVEGGVLVLKGEVESRRDKRLAESIVEDISGIEDVRNLLTIKKSPVEGWIPGIGSIGEDIKGGENEERK